MTGTLCPSARQVEAAKSTLLDADLMASLTLHQRADLVAVAFGTLREARAARLARHSRPRIVVSPAPGGAA